MQQKWISDHVIADIANDMVKLDIKITTVELNRAVSRYFKIKLIYYIYIIVTTTEFISYRMRKELMAKENVLHVIFYYKFK